MAKKCAFAMPNPESQSDADSASPTVGRRQQAMMLLLPHQSDLRHGTRSFPGVLSPWHPPFSATACCWSQPKIHASSTYHNSSSHFQTPLQFKIVKQHHSPRADRIPKPIRGLGRPLAYPAFCRGKLLPYSKLSRQSDRVALPVEAVAEVHLIGVGDRAVLPHQAVRPAAAPELAPGAFEKLRAFRGPWPRVSLHYPLSFSGSQYQDLIRSGLAGGWQLM